MRFNAKKLAEEIQESIHEVNGLIESETFAIYDDGVIQVQVRVTANDDDFCDDITDVDFVVAKGKFETTMKAVDVYRDALKRMANCEDQDLCGCLTCNWNGDTSKLVDGACPCCGSDVYRGPDGFAMAVLNQGADTLI